jgi:hypothetical protein
MRAVPNMVRQDFEQAFADLELELTHVFRVVSTMLEMGSCSRST